MADKVPIHFEVRQFSPPDFISQLKCLCNVRSTGFSNSNILCEKGSMMEAQVAELIKLLGSRNETTRKKAMDALVAIGSPAVQALIDVIVSRCHYSINISRKGTSTRFKVFGPASNTVQGRAFGVLTRIGVPALGSIVSLLRDDNPAVRSTIYLIIRTIGDENTLPHQIFADECLTITQKKDTLELLRSVRYNDPESMQQLHYNWPPLPKLCRRFILDPNPNVSHSAREMMEAFTLLRPSDNTDADKEAEELLRVAVGQPTSARPEELLLPASPENQVTYRQQGKSLMARLLRRN